MEKPYTGRATIHDHITELQIVIPAKRNWFVIIFMCAWLCGWLLGEVFAINMVTGALSGNPAGMFILFWLVAWTVGGIMAVRMLLWNLKGKEIITIGQNLLTIDKKGLLFYKAKGYDLNEVKNLRVQQNDFDGDWQIGPVRNRLGNYSQPGTMRFDYGLRTVKFASGIDEAEARYILERLKEKRLVGERNYN